MSFFFSVEEMEFNSSVVRRVKNSGDSVHARKTACYYSCSLRSWKTRIQFVSFCKYPRKPFTEPEKGGMLSL